MAKRRNRTRRRRSALKGTVRLALVFAALIGANVYIFWLRPRTSLPDLIKSSGAPAVIAPPPAGAAQPAARAKPAADDESDARVVEGVMTDGDTVERAWKRDGLQPRTVAELAQALSRVFDLGTVRAGHSYSLRFDAEDHLRALDYRMTPALGFHVERDPAVPGAWRATRDEKPLETRVAEVGGVVGSSLYDAIKRSGESTSLVGWFVDMFAWDLNFYIDSQAGDRFKLIVEKRYLGGKFYKYGRVLAAEYQARSGTFRAFWFQPKDGTPAGYYTEHGESVVKNLLKTPLKYVRVSSAFDRHRFHPILHTEKAHLGVDYAAPAGTPVWATANGKVTAVGPRGGAGNAITIAHANGLESVYMHLQRFARGLAVGQAVRQKQVIGYVGATGLATGPHLHFSLKQNGAFVDPRALKPAREAPLAPAYRVEFADAIAPRLTALAAIEVRAPDVVAHGPSAMP